MTHQTRQAKLIIELLDVEAPYRHGYYFLNTVWRRYVAHNLSVSILVYIGVYSILSKMNAFGIVQWAALLYVLHLNFRPNIFKTTSRKCWTAKYNSKAEPGSDKSRSVVLAVWILIAIISLITVTQLSNSIYASIS
jgi:hypothetical protein